VSRTSQLVQFLDLSLDAFCIAGFDGYLKYANPAFARILGYTQEELLARPFMDNVHPDDAESVGAVFIGPAEGKDTSGFECRLICTDGSVRRFKWNTHTRPDEGVVYGVARDVTDRRGASAELNALHRVATLVAEGVQPQDLFAIVAEEVSRVVDVSAVSVVRYELDGTATECANFDRGEKLFPVGVRWSIEGTNILRLIRDSAAAARIDDYAGLKGEMAAIIRSTGIRSTVGVPIVVAGRLWGTIVVSTTEPDPLPEDTASRLADFTELLATAIENAEPREALERLVDEQAALRRVATLVAHGVRPDEIFAAVSDEVGRLVGTDSAAVVRFDDDAPGIVFVGVASNMSDAFPLGARWVFEDGMASAEVYRTGRSARGGARDWSTVEGPVGETHHRLGIVSTVASPIVVEGRRWGAMTVQSQEPLPLDTEERLEKFTELVATAIANADSKSELAASRRRIVAASDEARRRIERDLHDGTQQRLVTLMLQLAAVREAAPTGEVLIAELSRVECELASALDELREMSRGIHPSILSEGGLGPALRALARRSTSRRRDGSLSRSRPRRTSLRRRPWPTRRSMRRRHGSTFRSRRATASCCCRSATTASAERIPARARDSSACTIASRPSAGRSGSRARPAPGRCSSSRFRWRSSRRDRRPDAPGVARPAQPTARALPFTSLTRGKRGFSPPVPGRCPLLDRGSNQHGLLQLPLRPLQRLVMVSPIDLSDLEPRAATTMRTPA
jgi:PAS domain S-box-containing protein